MIRAVVLDTGPLGLITNPKATPENKACTLWSRVLLDKGIRVIIPAIADYEIRRELLRANKTRGLKRLDEYCDTFEFLFLSPEALFHAAELWSQIRKMGMHTADDKALDGDVILAAQTLMLRLPASDVVIATTNSKHLIHFAQAMEWQKILP